MKHKVSELEGALLDEAVAKAEGRAFQVRNGVCYPKFDPHEASWTDADDLRPLAYSTSWALGGPIIQRERITVSAHGSGAAWHADHFDTTRRAYGPTPLIAGMRAFVASRFGDEVDDLP